MMVALAGTITENKEQMGTSFEDNRKMDHLRWCDNEKHLKLSFGSQGCLTWLVSHAGTTSVALTRSCCFGMRVVILNVGC